MHYKYHPFGLECPIVVNPRHFLPYDRCRTVHVSLTVVLLPWPIRCDILSFAIGFPSHRIKPPTLFQPQ